ncbi:hypothetical protein ABIE44_002359 [Marmoricola sp. OAE513]
MSTENNGGEPEAEQHRRTGVATVVAAVLVIGLALMIVMYFIAQ